MIIAVGFIIVSSSSIALTQKNIDNIDVEYTQDNLLKLNGSIIAEVTDEYFGAVFPIINLTKNYILEFNITQIGTNSYEVDGAIKIDVEVLGSFSRQFLLGRYLTVCILIIREIELSDDNDLQPRGRLLDRIIWSFDRFKLNSEDVDYVEIPLQYETSDITENASMYIFALGSLTGALAGDKPVFVRDKIDLEFLYNVSDIIDEIPPITVLELVGQI